MTHGISEKEWNDYLEGEAGDQLRDRIEAHLIGCLPCWEFHEQMALTTRILREAGEEMQSILALQDPQLRDGLHGVFRRIKAAESTAAVLRRYSIQKRLDALAAVMAPMCGSETAFKALKAAAKVSPARSLEQVTADNWAPFLTSLKSIAVVMCGETGAHLVWESGQLQ
ncbi:MAG TPA: zf-HC2 domain-containing protein [Blastocatellia bacterium]|nr:zf-HC2 domain-containing protein [Blastocatellia bacterium]